MTDLHLGDVHHLTVARRNTSSGTGALRTLPDALLATVEQGLLQFRQVAAERDTLREKLAALEQTHAQDQVEIASMQSLINRLESQAASHQCERDLAIAQ